MAEVYLGHLLAFVAGGDAKEANYGQRYAYCSRFNGRQRKLIRFHHCRLCQLQNRLDPTTLRKRPQRRRSESPMDTVLFWASF